MEQSGTPPRTLLPPEILLSVCQELAAERAFVTLYNTALAGRSVAPIALEQLYSICDVSPAIIREHTKRHWVQLWRSILLSTMGQTAFPYAAYIRTLSLGATLDDVLAEALGDKSERDLFCAPPLQNILVNRGGLPAPARSTRAAALPRIDTVATAIACGHLILEFVENLAKKSESTAALAHLEVNSLPPTVLSSWCLRVGAALVSLRLRDGSILNAEVGSSIARECPNFNDLTLFYCMSGTAGDQQDNLSAFLNELKPNKLQTFDLMRRNNMGESALVALGRQSQSLRNLRLGCLTLDGLRALWALTDCTRLECFELENEKHDRTDLVSDNPDLVKQLSAWIGNCQSMREFRATFQQDALHLVKELFCTSSAPIESIFLQHFTLLPEGHNNSVWDGLIRHKDTLRDLTIGYFWESQDLEDRANMSFHHPETTGLLDAICSLQHLKVLNIQGVWVDHDSYIRIITSLPGLEEIQFMSNEHFGDWALHLLGSLQNLKTVMIVTPTTFTFDALVSFVKKLDPIRQNGIQVDFMAQTAELPAQQEAELQRHFSGLNGRIGLGYVKNYDDDDQLDFSDSDA